jgi:hypothetical protein
MSRSEPGQWRKKERPMATIIRFPKESEWLRNGVFDQNDIAAMSMALDDACKIMKLSEGSPARALLAGRIVDLARRGERSPTRLRDRVLHEAGFAEYAGSNAFAHRKGNPSGDRGPTPI